VKYPRIKCPKCESDFGQEAKFLLHLTEVHGVIDHLKLYLSINHEGKHPTCGCKPECDCLLPWAGWRWGFTSKYARGHNARVDSIWNDKEFQKRSSQKRSEGYHTGKYRIWCEGKTKETDSILAISAEKKLRTINEGYASGRIVDWHLKDAAKAQEAAKRSSNTKKRRYKAGEIVPWNKGMTKHSSLKVKEIAEKIGSVVRENVSSSAKRFKSDELAALMAPALAQGKFKCLTDITTYRNKYQRMSFRCTACNYVQEKSLMMLLVTPICFHCHPKESKGQLEVLEFVRSLGVTATSSDRSIISPKEIDIYVPDHKLAIEYDGLWWHGSEKQVDQHRSQKKADACAALGIRFMVIYEDEWRDKRPIVESMIRHRLGKSRRVLNARKLKLEQLTTPIARQFFEENHLDGYANSTVAYGLFDSTGGVVAALALRRPFHASLGDMFEVSRSCPALDTNVRGWLGRLTKRAVKEARDRGKLMLLTYVDGRVGAGAGYRAAGWTLSKDNTGVRFWWTDYTFRWDRFKYTADKVRGMTQRQVADEAGVVSIFGCSNSLWQIDLRSVVTNVF